MRDPNSVMMLGHFESTDNGHKAHIFPLQIYWEDTDGGGIVYYANYLKFAERARTDMLRGLNIIQQQILTDSGHIFVVRDCQIDYLKPAVMDDKLTVVTGLTDLKGATLSMRQQIFRDTDLLVDSQVRVATLDKITGRPVRLLPEIKNKLITILQDS